MPLSTSTRRVLIVAAAAGLATPAFAQTAKDYVMQAGASDLFEIDEGKLMSNASNPQISKFAQQMVTAHTQSTAMVKKAAIAEGMHPSPPTLNADQQQMLTQLRAAHGKARDALYISQQKTSHQMALQLQQGFADSAPPSPLKTAATKIVPIVQQHIQELDAMPAM